MHLAIVVCDGYKNGRNDLDFVPNNDNKSGNTVTRLVRLVIC